MLKPGHRTLLLESLRPPPGFELDRCLGTTYSLDLQALLTAPLAFTIFEREDSQGRPNSDPLALLESLRRHAGRLHIFCQSGKIQIPKSQERLFTYLEDSVIQVSPRGGGVFHPKLWLLKYISPLGNSVYRLLCLSRNLTFDRSWDTILCLDGQVIESGDRDENQPLVGFLEDLPELAVHPLSEAATESIALFTQELGNIRFEVPEGFDSLVFHPLGMPQADQFSFPETAERLLTVSPFLSQKTIADFSTRYPGSLLLTRLESAQEVPAEAFRSYDKVFILPEDASPVADDQEGNEDDTPDLLTGLHAKLYVLDDGQQSRLWTGSANATEAAFRTNVEFLVELRGPRGQVGIEAILGRQSEKDALWGMLQEFVPRDEPPEPVDELQRQLEDEIEHVMGLLGRTRFQAQVSSLENEACKLSLSPSESMQRLPEDLQIECWPITVPETRKQMDADGSLSFAFSVSSDAMTAFFAFAVSGEKSGRKAQSRCVIKAELVGAPEDRYERLLQSLLHNQAQVLRLLLLLLSDDDSLNRMTDWAQKDGKSGKQAFDTWNVPLLESMLRSLHRDPIKLDRVNRLVKDLCRTAEGRKLLPESFLSIWETVWQARQEVLQ